MDIPKAEYIVIVPDDRHFRANLEALLYTQKIAHQQARFAGNRVVYDIIPPNGIITSREHARRLLLLARIREQEVKRVLIQGELVTPYIGALVKVAFPNTEVINDATPHSELYRFIEQERNRLVKRITAARE